MIGMGRVGERIRTKVNPFKITNVYSAFLLNVEVTVKEGALFPCKQIWEDVEFAHVLDKSGLKCLKMQRFSHSKCFRRKIRNPIQLHTWDNYTRLIIENDDPGTPSLSQLVTWFQKLYQEPEWSRKIIQLGTGFLEPEWRDLTQGSGLIDHELKFPSHGKHAIVISTSMHGNCKLWMEQCLQNVFNSFNASTSSDLQIVLLIPFWCLMQNEYAVFQRSQWKGEVLRLIDSVLSVHEIQTSVQSTVPIKDDGSVRTTCRSINGGAFVLSFERSPLSANEQTISTHAKKKIKTAHLKKPLSSDTPE